MTRSVTHMTSSAVTRMVDQLLSDHPEERIHVVLPEVLSTTATRICEALEARGIATTLQHAPEHVFRELPPAEAAEFWVPRPSSGLPSTLLLFGAQPWETSFEGDYRIELAAMRNREEHKACGTRLVFFEWPRGARLDAEVDLTADALADIFEKAMVDVYEDIRAWNETLLAKVASAQDIHIQCPGGTDLKLSVKNRKWYPEDCRLGEQEPAIYLPGGEIYTAAHEDSAEGRAAFFFCGEKLFAVFRDGLLSSVEREDGSEDVERGEEMGVGTEPLCEFGIGTNPWAPPWQIGTIYEKSAGTVHVAVGGNAHFGGLRDSPRHADLVIRNPTVTVDGTPLALPPARWKTFDRRSRRG